MNRIKFEKTKSFEKEKEYTSKIELHFFRHGEREPIKEKPNIEIALSQKGREQAIAKSKKTELSQVVAFGTPRIRAQETAGFVMAGKELALTGEETLKELKKKIDEGLKIGTKLGIEKKLDFPEDPTTEYYKAVLEVFMKEGNWLEFLINKSDELAKKYHDKKSFTYSRLAKQIAEIIQKYLKIAPRWNELVQDKSKNYKDTLERFMGTHATICESFLAKIIEKTKGKEEQNKFVQILKGGIFDYVEGFDLEISNTAEGPKIHIYYKKEKDGQKFVFDEYINPKLLDEIIKEGK